MDDRILRHIKKQMYGEKPECDRLFQEHEWEYTRRKTEKAKRVDVLGNLSPDSPGRRSYSFTKKDEDDFFVHVIGRELDKIDFLADPIRQKRDHVRWNAESNDWPTP